LENLLFVAEERLLSPDSVCVFYHRTHPRVKEKSGHFKHERQGKTLGTTARIEAWT
jgi:hypothetical protein